MKGQNSGMSGCLRKTGSGTEETKGLERMSLVRAVHERRWGRKVQPPGVGGWWPPPQLVNLHLHSLHLCQELLLRGADAGCQVRVCPRVCPAERSRGGGADSTARLQALLLHPSRPCLRTSPPGYASGPPFQSTPLGPFLLCSAAARPEASSCWQSPHSGSSVGVQGAEPEEYMLWGPERTPGGMRWARTESWRVFGVSAKDAVGKGSPWEPPNSAFCVIKGFSWRVHKVRGLGKSQELRV